MQTEYKELQRGRVLAGPEPVSHTGTRGGGAALKSCLRDGVGLAGAQRRRAAEGEAEGVRDRPELHAEVHQHGLHEGLIPPGHSTAQMTHDVTIHMWTLKRERFPAMANQYWGPERDQGALLL